MKVQLWRRQAASSIVKTSSSRYITFVEFQARQRDQIPIGIQIERHLGGRRHGRHLREADDVGHENRRLFHHPEAEMAEMADVSVLFFKGAIAKGGDLGGVEAAPGCGRIQHSTDSTWRTRSMTASLAAPTSDPTSTSPTPTPSSTSPSSRPLRARPTRKHKLRSRHSGQGDVRQRGRLQATQDAADAGRSSVGILAPTLLHQRAQQPRQPAVPALHHALEQERKRDPRTSLPERATAIESLR